MSDDEIEAEIQESFRSSPDPKIETDWEGWARRCGEWRAAWAGAHKRAASKEAECERLREALKHFADGDCAYGDSCPVFGSRHGRCVPCLARTALESRPSGSAK